MGVFMNETIGKPPRVRKLEFLIDHYREQQIEMRECSTEWFKQEKLIQALHREYTILTGRVYKGKHEYK